MLTRRMLLRGSAVVVTGMGSTPGWLARAAEADSAAKANSKPRRRVLIVIFQRGAADGLNIVIPFAERRYYEMRPVIAVPPPSGIRPGANPGVFGPSQPAIDLDGRFGLHSALEPLKPLWDRRELAIVEAAGSPDPSRSHFDAQDYMESGVPGKTVGDGWLNRALPLVTPGTSPLRAISTSAQLPHTLRGDHPAIAIGAAQQMQLSNQDASNIFERMYASSADQRMEQDGKDAFAALKMLNTVNRAAPDPSAAMPYQQGGELGRNLQQIARLIKADVGVEAAFAELDGWDHHGNEGPQLTNMLRQFGNAIAAFSTDMGDRMEDVILVTMSEFGRTAEENGTGGTDHGHGNLMMVVGGSVDGGKIFGEWPGLEREQLNEGRDLKVTTDFRTVLTELITAQMGQKDLARVFPGFTPAAPLGLLRA
ncbi:MAG TPA: DUF1501 domain-containing protein [Bryobacteraceae bacterium]|nr:DUF1501 domain-containing protein [Bryobacteraceae bacterium]